VRSLRSGRISERATMVETTTTRNSSSSVTRLVTSRLVVASDLSALARLVIWPARALATVWVSWMVSDMSAFQSAASSWRLLVSGTVGELVAICSARISLEDATSTLAPLTVLL